MSYIVRAVQSSELKQLASINVKCLKENYATSFWKKEFSACPELFIAAFALGGNRPVGYVAGRKLTALDPQLLPKSITEIFSFAILPPHRGRGLGKILLNAFIEAVGRTPAARDAMQLHVRVSNEPAIRLYTGCGFVEKCRQERYYADGEAALLMQRDAK
eukprot:gnl/Hemi2/14442_TR4893_c1_g3_i1.p1 gnl/Hemi2/14442_TR4893_c1_g3~~gnl/Hemi2/14442_TR4893_c1_g3_i1.p1  ORF type:complete len:160 (+),score=17.99 gnl/Hemi2/14442_TR4893_c1_g3_i1:154-633(+)